MATILDLGGGRFIAGDPPESPGAREHWCRWCGGDGLELALEGGYDVCGGCFGTCVEECDDGDCEAHPTAPTASAAVSAWG